MQILPASTHDSRHADLMSLVGAQPAAPSGADFARLLEQAQATPRELPWQASPRAAEASGKSQALHSGEALPGLALREDQGPLRVTEEDFAALEPDLREAGLPEEDIAALHDQVTGQDGLSWHGLMQQVNQRLDAPQTASATQAEPLTNNEEQDLRSFLQKLGCNPNEASDIISNFATGNTRDAWKAIQARIDETPPGKTITLRREELAALTKAQGLSADVAASFGGVFDAKGEAVLGQNGLKAIAATLRNAGEARHGSLANRQLDPARQTLNDSLRQALSQALTRADRERQADNKETRDVQNQDLLIQDAAARNHRAARAGNEEQDPNQIRAAQLDPADRDASRGKIANAASDGSSRLITPARPEQTGQTGQTGQAGQAGQANPEQDAVSRKPESTQDKRPETVVDPARKQDAAQGKASDGKSSDAKSHDAPLRDLWNKVDLDARSTRAGEPRSAQADQASQVAQALGVMTPQQVGQAAGKGTEVLRQERVDAEQVLRTVEQGMLRSLAEGKKQLTLRMDPPDLGKVTVILQVGANKEVSAILKTDSQDTAQLMSQQLAQLKDSLEQQGFKVEKLDVQTGLAQQQGQGQAQWNGADSHNQARERQAMQAENRAWGFLRRAAVRDGELAQDMHIPGHGEVSSRQARTALDLIA